MKIPVLKPSIKTMTLLAAVAGLLCVGGILIYMVESSQVKLLATKAAEKQKEVDDSEKISGRIESAKANYIKAQSELFFLETSVSDYAYIPTLLGQLEQLGKSHNLRVVSVRPQIEQKAAAVKPRSEEIGSDSKSEGTKKKIEKPKPYEELKITVELEGSYWCIHDFMLSLTKFPKIIAVKELSVAPVSSTTTCSKTPQLKANLVVIAFMFKPEAGNDKTSKPASMPPVMDKASVSAGRSSNEG